MYVLLSFASIQQIYFSVFFFQTTNKQKRLTKLQLGLRKWRRANEKRTPPARWTDEDKDRLPRPLLQTV